MHEIRVFDYSEFPGPRKESIGPNSGERFREEVLLKAIEKHGGHIKVILDDTAGYGSSFLEEAFGGLIRRGIPTETVREIVKNLVSVEDESLITEISEYVEDEIKKSHKG